MTDEPWIKPQQSYYQRRIDQHRKWYQRHFDELSPGARIAISELLHLNEQADQVIGELTRQLLEAKATPNPDARHEAFQRDGHKPDMVLRRHRNEWEER